MKYLLDTRVFIWLTYAPSRIKSEILHTFSIPDNHLHISGVSIWEIAHKKGTGKLEFDVDYNDVISRFKLTYLPLEIYHIEAMERLEKHHKDPFDLMIAAQAKYENLILATHDEKMMKYDILCLPV